MRVFFRFHWLLAWAALLVSLSGPAAAQDWCRSEPSLTDELICLNSELADLDARVTQILTANPNIDPDGIEQKRWLIRRNACQDDYECVLVSYEKRVRALERDIKAAVRLPEKVAIPPQRPPMKFALPEPDPSCDFPRTQSTSCAEYAADAMRRYYQYVTAAIASLTADPSTDGPGFQTNIHLCGGDPWCLWRKYSNFAEAAYNQATFNKLPVVDAPEKLRVPPLYADGRFTCSHLLDDGSQSFRIRLTPWIDGDENRVLAMSEYGKWNIILVDEDHPDVVHFEENIAGWWQVRLVETEQFLNTVWSDSPTNAWIVIRHLQGSGSLESIYAFGDKSGSCYTFPDTFEPLRQLRILPREAADYFYQLLVDQPVIIPLDQQSIYPDFDVEWEKMQRIKEYLSKESIEEQHLASDLARKNAVETNPSGMRIERSLTLIPSKAKSSQ